MTPFLCTALFLSCFVGPWDQPTSNAATEIERLNEARAARQGTTVTLHRAHMPHRSDRKPIGFVAALDRHDENSSFSTKIEIARRRKGPTPPSPFDPERPWERAQAYNQCERVY